MKLVVVGTVIRKDNKILMVQEEKADFKGKWNLPAGKLDDSEGIKATAIRKVKEETGYDVKLLDIVTIKNVYKNHKKEFIAIIFTGELISGKVSFNPKEINQVDWIDINDIQNYDVRDLVKETIEDVKSGKCYPLEIIDDVE